MPRLKKLVAAVVIFIVFLSGGFYFWKNWLRETELLKREPLSDSTPGSSKVPDLEHYLPEGAKHVAALQNLSQPIAQFKQSKFWVEFTSITAQARQDALKSLGIKREIPGENIVLLKLFEDAAVLGVYPVENSEALMMHSSPFSIPSSPRLPKILFVARVPENAADLESQFPGRGKSEVYKGLPVQRFILNWSSGCMVSVNHRKFLLVSNDFDLVNKALDIFAAKNDKSASPPTMADAGWLKEGLNRIEKQSLMYLLTKNEWGSGKAKMSPFSFPPVVAWTASQWYWQIGLKMDAYSRFSGSVSPEIRKAFQLAPADLPILRFVSRDSFFAFATNSIQSPLRMIADSPFFAKMVDDKHKAILDGIGEQLAFQIFKVDSSAPVFGIDGSVVVQIQNRWKTRASLKKALSALKEKGAAVEKKDLAHGGSCFEIINQGKSWFICLEDRWIICASSLEALGKTVKQFRTNENPPQDVLALFPQKSNLLFVLDFYELAKKMTGPVSVTPGILGVILGQQKIYPYLEILSVFKKGGYSFNNEKQGFSGYAYFPFEDVSAEDWRRMLKPFRELVVYGQVHWTQVQMESLANKARSQVLEALTQYKKKNRKYPAALRNLIPKLLPALPEDPYTGSVRVVSLFDGKGGWVYDRGSGNFFLNFEPVKLAPKLSFN